ncbi:MAG TPA: hypothetical protein VK123_08660, partial [Candidatus Limnocylindrales bacterium]|nr:hypothetical protein [Candidatus Limnocylindrales bacterium]
MPPDPSDPDVLYTSDLHGSRTHYEEAFRLAEALGVRAVVLGGDLSPMGDPATQGSFHESFLVPFLRDFLGRPGAPEVFAILGNVDWRANESLLLDARIPRFHYLHSRVAPFLDGALIAGLNCVPPTPIRLKDWERWEPEHWESSRLDGFRSAPDGSLYPFTFAGRENEESLEADFDSLEAAVLAARGGSAAGPLVCVFHGPPFGTACDQITGGTHVGSRAA